MRNVSRNENKTNLHGHCLSFLISWMCFLTILILIRHVYCHVVLFSPASLAPVLYNSDVPKTANPFQFHIQFMRRNKAIQFVCTQQIRTLYSLQNKMLIPAQQQCTIDRDRFSYSLLF